MRTVSKISSLPREGKPAGSGGAGKETLRQRRRRLLEEYAAVVPPKPRRRMREARRWLDELTVRCTNGRVCERRPGARHISFPESAEIHRRGLADLEASDPELYKAVRRVISEELIEDFGISQEEWRRQAMRRVRRISKVRAAMQRAGSI